MKTLDIRLSVKTVLVCLFLINLFGYTGLRYFISHDIYGGDTVNMVTSRMDSCTLKHSNFLGDPSLFYTSIFSGRNEKPEKNPNAFIYDLLSQQGREALEHLVKAPANERNRELFVLELNKSVIDKEINWPTSFELPDSLRAPSQTKAGKLYYNLQVLSSLYPNNIRDNLNPAFQWKYDLPSLLNTIPQVLTAYSTINTPTRYAPLTTTYTTEVQRFLQNSPERTIYAIILTGFIYATLMLFVFLTALKFLESISWSLIAVFLFQSAVSSILISIQLFSLPYLFVPLVMVAAIYSYLQYKDHGGMLWLTLYSSLAMVAPWFREFPGAIPFIVFANEILNFKRKRSVVILLISIPLMLHSIYPSFLPWLIGINGGGVYNVFSQGNVQQVTNANSLNWQMFGFLFVQFSPILWIILSISIGCWLWSRFSLSEKVAYFKILLSSEQKVFVRFRPLLILSIGIVSCLLVAVFVASRNQEQHLLHGIYLIALIAVVLLVIIVTLSSLKFNTLLPIYFAATFIPFLRLGLAELHLSFTLVPLSIIFILWIRDLFSSLSYDQGNKRRTTAYSFLVAFSIIGLTDHALNIPAAVFAQKNMVETNKAMGEWLKNNTQKHSIVVMNFYNFTDVFYYSNYHFDPYETVENCPMGPTRVVHENKDFEKLFNNNLGVRDVYLLASEHEFRRSNEESYHSHKYVRNPPGKLEQLAEFPMKSEYLYLDPFKYFIPRYFVSFIGYMDWSIDFFYDNTHFPFKRVVSTNYVLYRLKDISNGFRSSKPQEPPKLIDSYRRYNVVSYNGYFYAVPQYLGSLDLSNEKDRKREGILLTKDLNKIKDMIDKDIQSRPPKDWKEWIMRGIGR